MFANLIRLPCSSSTSLHTWSTAQTFTVVLFTSFISDDYFNNSNTVHFSYSQNNLAQRARQYTQASRYKFTNFLCLHVIQETGMNVTYMLMVRILVFYCTSSSYHNRLGFMQMNSCQFFTSFCTFTSSCSISTMLPVMFPCSQEQSSVPMLDFELYLHYTLENCSK